MGFNPAVLCLLFPTGEDPVGLGDEETVYRNKLIRQTSSPPDGYLFGERVSSQ